MNHYAKAIAAALGWVVAELTKLGIDISFLSQTVIAEVSGIIGGIIMVAFVIFGPKNADKT